MPAIVQGQVQRAVQQLRPLCLVSTLLAVALLLQGCGSEPEQKDDPDTVASLQRKVAALQTAQEEGCEEKCKYNSLYGRWSGFSFAHSCWDEDRQTVECQCSGSADTPPGCKPLDGSAKGTSLTALSSQQGANVEALGAQHESHNHSLKRRIKGRRGNYALDLADGFGSLQQESRSQAGTAVASLAVDARGAAVARAATVIRSNVSASSRAEGSPRQTVTDFCDIGGLAEMHGKEAPSDLDTYDAVRDLESKILGDVARELETNNVDKMAKEIFSFYVCARWAPDETFWQLAEQELAAQIVDSTVNKDEKPGQAIAELYQTYKFVPLLCSQNLEVFRETDDTDHTYFSKFREDVGKLVSWLKKAAVSPVGKRLREIDQVFCGDRPMNDCAGQLNYEEMLKSVTSWCPRWMCGEHKTREDLWKEMELFFKSFKRSDQADDAEWNADFSTWKERFPYHSFIAKPEGWTGEVSTSPRAEERFVICFGKRVASELHRRPNGQHILTDQNNIGCHGWYGAEAAGTQLQRVLDLWKPPTCQLATMAYTMKKEIMAKFAEMNERLFDSLPSMINDEMMAEELGGSFDFEEHLPKPFDRKSLQTQSVLFVDGMRVTAAKEECLAREPCGGGGSFLHSSECVDGERCALGVSQHGGDLGVVRIKDNEVQVVWDKDEKKRPFTMSHGSLKVLPQAWTGARGFKGHVKDLVAGVGQIKDRAIQIFNAMFSKKYVNLADLMSGSVSKWAVCPIKGDANIELLDANLGVEDAAFHDFQKDAYKKWTGYKAAVPGEKCSEVEELLGGSAGAFPGFKACEISELMADHVERYVKSASSGNREEEPFICPIRPPLPADEQLTVLQEKAGMCYLRMTSEQERQHVWHYQGKFPARRQNDRKENKPRQEFELVKLLKVPGGGPESEVSFGRYCSLEEHLAAPRFCQMPKVHNSWPSLEEMAQSLSEGLQGALGIGATAVASSIAAFQGRLLNGSSTGGDRTEQLKRTALALGEKSWDMLVGAGRLVQSSGKWVKDHLKGELPGDKRIYEQLQARYFGANSSGELLHMLSFQRATGEDGRTSNAKARYQRYIMQAPCSDFDPVLAFSLRRKWSRVALQMLEEANRMRTNPSVLMKPSLHLLIRGEGLRYRREHEHAKATWFYRTQAAMQWVDPEAHGMHAEAPACRKDGTIFFDCLPKEFCEKTLTSCRLKPWWNSEGWWSVRNTKLAKVVAPTVTTGDIDLRNLYGMQLSVYCAPKKDFPASGPPQSPSSRVDDSLLECLQEGVVRNAQLRAQSPWKLYFPDEVVVVVVFQETFDHRCMVTKAGQEIEKTAEALCADAVVDPNLDKHVWDPTGHTSGEYMGMHTGAGFPKGSIEEVVLRPEDVLEALGLMVPSAHGSWR